MKNLTKCIRISDGRICLYCNGSQIIKNGKTKNGKQQFHCKDCCKRFIDSYTYHGCQININQQIILFTKEGLGIRGTARILKISTTTLLKRIISIAKSIQPPSIPFRKEYEVDELRTYVKSKNKLIWIVCALERKSKKIISFNIGKRTNQTLNKVVQSLHLSQAKKIFTDRLKNYKYLIEKGIHETTRFGTNSIERKNLDLRIHLKRLNRKTICFSKSTIMLSSILKIYFWG